METKIESGKLLEANTSPSFWTRGRLVSLYTTAVTALGTNASNPFSYVGTQTGKTGS